jgi:hypothetical protein
MISLSLTEQQCAVLAQLINSVSGVENQRVLIPIFDIIKTAVEKNGELRNPAK